MFTGLKDSQALWDQSKDTLLLPVWCQGRSHGLCAGLLNQARLLLLSLRRSDLGAHFTSERCHP